MLSALADGLNAQTAACNVLVLGVTPEVVGLDWPDQVSIQAYDQSPDMIRAVWRPHPRCESVVTQARWEEIPLPDASAHAIAGDGSLNALPRLDAYPAVLGEMHRVLVPGGRAALRCFLRPDTTEPLDAIAKAVFKGQVGGVSSLKWRLAMALAEPYSASIELGSVYQAYDALFPSPDALASATGWSHEEIATIFPYRDSPTRLNFPTLAQFKAACAPWFDVTNALYGDYELSTRCPTLVMTRRDQM